MYERKVDFILVVLALALLSSCSVFNRSGRSDRSVRGSFAAGSFIKEVVSNNISSSGFRIDRVRVVADLEDGKHRFSGNLKYDENGKILFSARAIAGIEMARIYIDKNDIIVLDRINRIYYYGETKTVLQKYNLSWEDIFVLFGDMPSGIKSNDRVFCDKGKTDILTVRPGTKIGYTIDCDMRKLTNIRIDNEREGILNANYSGISRVNGGYFPSEVLIEDSRGRFGLELSYDRFDKYEGGFEKPGQPRGYELSKLL